MPEELHERLVRSARAEGRSLNKEILAHLEASVPVETHQGRGEYLMLRKYRRPAFALGLVAAVALLLAIVAGVSNAPQVSVKSQKLFGDPDRMSLKNRATPGLRGQGDLAPAATQLALEQLGNKTYPASTLPFKWQKGAMDAFNVARNRGADGSGTWQLAGPAIGTYPSILNRTNADYVASGRVSALAIAPTCVPGNCRVWVAAAGGGIWRTDDALASTPSWTYVSSSFGHERDRNADLRLGDQHALRGHRRAERLGRLRRRRRHLRVDQRWRHLDAAAGQPGDVEPAISVDRRSSAAGSTLYVGTALGVRRVAASAAARFRPRSLPTPRSAGLWKSTDGGRPST